MAGPVHGSARALLAALLAPALVALVALLVAPARGRGGRDHGDWDTAGLLPPLPPREDAARVARFVTHVCDWGALATISTQEAVRGWAFADVLSLSDGPPGAGSGVPYFYLSPMQQLVGNLQKNPSATLTMSLAQTNFCRKHGFDPQSPLCAHIILSGTVTKVNETEVDVAKQSLFIRHPEMKDWPSSHNWFFAKLNITNIWLLDYFGGPKIVTPEEYYNATFQSHGHICTWNAGFMFTEVLADALDKQFPQLPPLMVQSEHQASCHLLGCAYLALVRTGEATFGGFNHPVTFLGCFMQT